MPLYDYRCSVPDCNAMKEVSRKIAEREKEKVCEARGHHDFTGMPGACLDCGLEAADAKCPTNLNHGWSLFHTIAAPSNINYVAASEWRGGTANGGVHTRTRPQMGKRPLKKGFGNY